MCLPGCLTAILTSASLHGQSFFFQTSPHFHSP
uniref:Uncharacterized protein n=1 Tax=Arundo donax TaxID=35708 RepID=A0A0A9FQ37_ARUDO